MRATTQKIIHMSKRISKVIHSRDLSGPSPLDRATSIALKQRIWNYNEDGRPCRNPVKLMDFLRVLVYCVGVDRTCVIHCESGSIGAECDRGSKPIVDGGLVAALGGNCLSSLFSESPFFSVSPSPLA